MMPPPGLIADAVPAHPLLAGRSEVGRGEYTIVLAADTVDGQERVYKLVTDPTDYAYYTAADRPIGPHFPVVYADHGIAGMSSRGFPFHIIEVERLYPLPEQTPSSEIAQRLISAYFDACRAWKTLAENMGRIALHHIAVTPLGFAPPLQDALQALSVFAQSYDALPDLLKTDNLMTRQDGTLVFSDPVFIG